jgi:polar amino acid transport system ATP-binding protein
VTKRFGDRLVVDTVSLDVAAGEVVAVIGPSGAGKSTLIRCVNYLEVPTSGRVYLDGRLVGQVESRGRLRPASRRQLAELRRSVGMVFQSFNLFPHLTALENVAVAQVHALGRPKADARRRGGELLELVGLGALVDRHPSRLSGGEQQRVAIARALALDPRVMLFDEPTSSIDPELRVDVLAVMRRLADDGMTMIVVTHEMRFAADVADRVVFMADGCAVEQGPPEHVLRAPQHERTRRFLKAILEA